MTKKELKNVVHLLKYDNPGGNESFKKLCGIIDTGEPVDAIDIKRGRKKI